MEKFLKQNLLHLVTWAAALIGAGYLSIYRIDALEERADRAERASTDIRDTLGAVQLDVALLCAETVKARGGNPLQECKTSGGHAR